MLSSRLSIPLLFRLPITSKKPWSKSKTCRTKTETSTLHDTSPSTIKFNENFDSGHPATPDNITLFYSSCPALYSFHNLINLGPVSSRMNLYQMDVLVELHSSWRNPFLSKNSEPSVFLRFGLMDERIGMVIAYCVVVVAVIVRK